MGEATATIGCRNCGHVDMDQIEVYTHWCPACGTTCWNLGFSDEKWTTPATVATLTARCAELEKQIATLDPQDDSEHPDAFYRPYVKAAIAMLERAHAKVQEITGWSGGSGNWPAQEDSVRLRYALEHMKDGDCTKNADDIRDTLRAELADSRRTRFIRALAEIAALLSGHGAEAGKASAVGLGGESQAPADDSEPRQGTAESGALFTPEMVATLSKVSFGVGADGWSISVADAMPDGSWEVAARPEDDESDQIVESGLTREAAIRRAFELASTAATEEKSK